MYQRNKILKEEAEKRLQAIREYTDLGSGIKIAMRDLEIRGAGNLLGSEQHGHMEAVGYDLYCKMLNMAVKKEKGELEMEETFETTVDIPISAYIPDSYIRNEEDRMEIYKRIAAVETEEESMDMIDELIDRFGECSRSRSPTCLRCQSFVRMRILSILKKSSPRQQRFACSCIQEQNLTRCVCRI